MTNGEENKIMKCFREIVLEIGIPLNIMHIGGVVLVFEYDLQRAL